MSTPPAYTLPALLEREGALLLKIRASPGASRERVMGVHGEALKVCVSAPREKGKANEAIQRVLARHFGLRESQVSLHSGERSRDKWFRLEGLSLPEAQAILNLKLKASKAPS